VLEVVRHIIHRPEAHSVHRQVKGGLARAAVFGMSDGLTSNVLLVIGFAGSGVNASVVRLAGLAGALSGAVSMAAGEWISVSAQNEMVQREVDVERRELKSNSVAEQMELAAMYEGHGMEPQTAARAAADVMRDQRRALTVHAREELGIDPEELPSPWRAAGLSLVCFIVGALLPVIPWFAGSGTAAIIGSLGLGGSAAIVLGWTIGTYAERRPAIAAVRQVSIMLGACVVTFFVGKLLGVEVS
jgi:VIT1/CCC1 family predicted Fe2+/Mn2+ transporter